MVVVSHCDDTDFGTFFEFETIGMCPIDLTPVLPKMLTAEEEWLNFYHEDVRHVLKPLLTDKEFEWLEKVTMIGFVSSMRAGSGLALLVLPQSRTVPAARKDQSAKLPPK